MTMSERSSKKYKTLLNTIDVQITETNIDNFMNKFDLFKISNIDSKDTHKDISYYKLYNQPMCIIINQHFCKYAVALKGDFTVKKLEDLHLGNVKINKIDLREILNYPPTIINLFLNLYAAMNFPKYIDEKGRPTSTYGKFYYPISNQKTKRNNFRYCLSLKYFNSLKWQVKSFMKTNRPGSHVRYLWDDNDLVPKQVYEFEKGKEYWIEHKEPGNKHAVDYFQNGNYSDFRDSEIVIIQNLLDDLNSQFEKYIHIDFNSVNSADESAHSMEKSKQSYLEGLKQRYVCEPINVVDLVKSKESKQFIKATNKLLQKEGIAILNTNKKDEYHSGYNLAIIEPKENYQDKTDPHRNSYDDVIIQNITTSNLAAPKDSLESSSLVIKLFQEFDVKRSILENHIPKSVFEENKLFAGYTFITFDENNNAIIFENTSDGVTQFESVQKKNFFDETNSRYSTIRGFIADNNIKPESVKWQIECIFFKDLDNLNLIKRTDYYAFPEISEIGYRLLWANPDNLVKVNLLISDLKNFEQTQKSPSVKKDVFDVCEYLEELDIGKVTMGHFRKLMKDDFGFRGNSKVMKEFVNYKFKRNRMNPKLPSNYLPFSNHKGGELKQSYGSLYGIHIYRELDGISSSNKEKFYYKYILIADSTENVRLSYNNGHPIRKLISEKENSISESLLIKMFDVDFIRVNQPTVRPYAVKFNKEFSKMNPVTK